MPVRLSDGGINAVSCLQGRTRLENTNRRMLALFVSTSTRINLKLNLSQRSWRFPRFSLSAPLPLLTNYLSALSSWQPPLGRSFLSLGKARFQLVLPIFRRRSA